MSEGVSKRPLRGDPRASGKDPPAQGPEIRSPKASVDRLPSLRPPCASGQAGRRRGRRRGPRSPGPVWAKGDLRIRLGAPNPEFCARTGRRRRFPRLTPRRLAHNQRPRSGLRPDASWEGWQSGQMQRTVNPSGQPYAGSNPAPSTIPHFGVEKSANTLNGKVFSAVR